MCNFKRYELIRIYLVSPEIYPQSLVNIIIQQTLVLIVVLSYL